MQLKPGSTLQNGKYRIIKALGQGGFGITYLAEHTELEREVCIKEFFMKDFCDRDEATSQVSLGTSNNQALMQKYQEKFKKEARMIAKLNHPNVIRIHDVFSENNTAYYVTDFIEGSNLNDVVKSKGALLEAQALKYIRAVGRGLEYVHSKKITHLDIKPGNIMLGEGDEPVLIDFGMSKQYDEAGEQTSSTPIGISAGYAPLEQYKAGGVSEFSPQTDVYALAATLYRLVTGVVPPQAADVADDGLPEMPATISASTRAAIEKGMQFRKKDRPATVSEFLAMLEGVKASATKPKVPDEEATRLVEPEVTVLVEPEPEPGDERAVDLGLSVRWASMNLGAEKPGDYGDYYAWGETKPKDRYDWDNLKYCNDTTGDSFSKYNQTEGGTKDNRKVLKPMDDAATANWGAPWRMPTTREWKELRSKCRWTWTTRDGHKGCRVTGPNGKSIFLPAAGDRNGSSSNGVGSWGNYWSSSLNESYSDSARDCYFDSDRVYSDSSHYRCGGFSVRPVLEQ